MLQEAIIELDVVLTGLPRSICKTNMDRQGVRGFLGGDRYYLSDGYSRLYWDIGRRVLCVDPVSYSHVKECFAASAAHRDRVVQEFCNAEVSVDRRS